MDWECDVFLFVGSFTEEIDCANVINQIRNSRGCQNDKQTLAIFEVNFYVNKPNSIAARTTASHIIMSDKDKVQYCFNPATKEVVEGANPPSCNFIPIVGYFPRTLVNEDLQRKIEEIASL